MELVSGINTPEDVRKHRRDAYRELRLLAQRFALKVEEICESVTEGLTVEYSALKLEDQCRLLGLRTLHFELRVPVRNLVVEAIFLHKRFFRDRVPVGYLTSDKTLTHLRHCFGPVAPQAMESWKIEQQQIQVTKALGQDLGLGDDDILPTRSPNRSREVHRKREELRRIYTKPFRFNHWL